MGEGYLKGSSNGSTETCLLLYWRVQKYAEDMLTGW